MHEDEPPAQVTTIAEDPPAAHSMDVEWFAVDADGHVGLFRTGEDAAFPDAGAARQDLEVVGGEALFEHAVSAGWWGPEDEAEERRVTAVPTGHAWLAAAEAQAVAWRSWYALARTRWEETWRLWRWVTRQKEPQPCAEVVYGGLVVVDGAAPVPDGTVHVQRIGAVQVARVSSISLAALQQLHAEGRCVACVDAPRDEYNDEYRRAGIFTFAPEIDYAGNILSPYRRVSVPSRPRRLAEFGAELVRGMNVVRLTDDRFERDELVQPARTLRCQGYSGVAPAYLDVDLRTVRPQRGMEGQYAEMLAELRRGSPNWRFVDGG